MPDMAFIVHLAHNFPFLYSLSFLLFSLQHNYNNCNYNFDDYNWHMLATQYITANQQKLYFFNN